MVAFREHAFPGRLALRTVFWFRTFTKSSVRALSFRRIEVEHSPQVLDPPGVARRVVRVPVARVAHVPVKTIRHVPAHLGDSQDGLELVSQPYLFSFPSRVRRALRRRPNHRLHVQPVLLRPRPPIARARRNIRHDGAPHVAVPARRRSRRGYEESRRAGEDQQRNAHALTVRERQWRGGSASDEAAQPGRMGHPTTRQRAAGRSTRGGRVVC